MLTLNKFAEKWLKERGYYDFSSGPMINTMAENVLNMIAQSNTGISPKHAYELMLLKNIIRDYEEGKSWMFDVSEMYRCAMCGKKYEKVDEHTYKFACKCVGDSKLRISIG